MSSTTPQRTLLITVAHPDDETFGCGALIANAAASGIRVIVCSASRGELGEDASGLYPTPAALGAAREQEFREAAAALGAAEAELLGLIDSGWAGEPAPGSIVAESDRLAVALGDALERHRPGAVVTMDPTGSDGHRDHAAVGAATDAAFATIVDWPASLYHWCLPHSLMDAWGAEIAAQNPDSVYLGTELGRADADVTTVLDGRPALARVRSALGIHRTQTSPFATVSEALTERFLSEDHLVRQVPPWPGGPPEDALTWPTLTGDEVLPAAAR